MAASEVSCGGTFLKKLYQLVNTFELFIGLVWKSESLV